MATLPRFLLAAWRCEKAALASSVRHLSELRSSHRVSSNKCSPFIASVFHHDALLNGSPASSVLHVPLPNPLLERIGIPILPPSPCERKTKLKLPSVSKQTILEMPTTKASLDNAHINQKVVEIKAPQKGKIVELWAIRMLVIRHKKMKKHQRKKFRKKFRVLLMNRKKKHKILTETAFLSEIEAEMKLGESFNAQEYVADKLNRAYRPVPVKEKFVKAFPWEFTPLHHLSNKKNEK